MSLLAQSGTLWEDVVRGLAGNGLWVFLSVMFLMEALKSLGRRYMQHRERMAMIDAGFNPADLEHPGGSSPSDAIADDAKGTSRHRARA